MEKIFEAHTQSLKNAKLTTSSGIHERLLIFFESLSPLQDADQGTVLDNQVKWIDHKVQWTRHLKSFSQSVKYGWFIASISKYEKKRKKLTNSIDSGDGMDILNRFPIFYLYYNENVSICRFQVIWCGYSPYRVCEWTSESSSSDWRESAIGNDLLGFLDSGHLK